MSEDNDRPPTPEEMAAQEKRAFEDDEYPSDKELDDSIARVVGKIGGNNDRPPTRGELAEALKMMGLGDRPPSKEELANAGEIFGDNVVPDHGGAIPDQVGAKPR